MQVTLRPAAAPTSSARSWVIIGLLSLGMIIAYVDRTREKAGDVFPRFVAAESEAELPVWDALR